MLETIISFLRQISFTNALLLLLAENLIIFILALFVGEIFIKVFHKSKISNIKAKISSQDIVYSLITVFLNSLVTFAGFIMWRIGIVNFTITTTFYILLDAIMLLLIMDFAMYFLHRIAHNKYIFNLIHNLHHRYTEPNPLTLFILSPSEAIGFGSLWLFVLILHDWSWIGMSIYLALNVAFGTIGHLGVEPFPKVWTKIPLLKYISTSTFHFQHHNDKDSNYGFYTTIWDKMFRSLRINYESDFKKLK